MRLRTLCCGLCLAAAAFGSHAQPVTGKPLPATTLHTTADGVSVRHGGFGSDAAADPQNPRRFYALTDRGPNADAVAKDQKIFVTPDFVPTIGHFEIGNDGNIRHLRSIRLQRPGGRTPLSGLPNPPGMGATGETAVGPDGRLLGTDPYGLDAEGLVVMPNGDFWVSDEYGPHLVRFNRNGLEQERISPTGMRSNSRRSLPAVLAKRTPNRGMEGLTLAPDGHTLIGIMQSALNNPDKAQASNRTLTRIVALDLRTGRSRQYLYRQNADNLSHSAILALDGQRLLVNERDGRFHQPGVTAQKHVYLIDLSGASDVSDPQDSPQGLLVNGKTLEQNSWEELAAAGIRPVGKTLVLDLVAANGYPHDKFEGMWRPNPQQLAVINDDDFAIAASDGRVVQKQLPATGQTDANTLYFYPLTLP